jgi:acyl-CoA thioester hydrolase
MHIPAPFDDFSHVVQLDWIDHNEHMNMGYYMVVFDFATDAWFQYLGLGPDYRRASNTTTFSLEGHITYQREMRGGERMRFTTQLLDFDEKRIHYFHRMYHAEAGFLAATNELMSIHIGGETRRSAPMAPHVLEKLALVKRAHAALPKPPEAGRVIGLKSPRTTGGG